MDFFFDKIFPFLFAAWVIIVMVVLVVAVIIAINISSQHGWI